MTRDDVYPNGDDGRASIGPTRRGQDSGGGPSRDDGDPRGEDPSLLATLFRRAFTIVAFTFAFLFAGLGYLAIMPPRYLASSALLIDSRLGKGLGTDATQPGFVADGSAIDSQVKLLTSQTVLERVAAMTDLSNDPEFNGTKRGFIQVLLNPNPVLSGKVDLRALEDAITIKRPDRTYIVQVDVLARDPKKAAEIANALTKAYTADQLAARLDAAGSDTKFVDQRLKTLRDEIKDAETKIEVFKTRNKTVTTVGLRSNEQQITDLTRALSDARARGTDAKSRADEIDRLARTGHLDASSAALKSFTMDRLRQQQAEAGGQEAKIERTLGERHPSLREARSQIAEIDGLIRAELQRLKVGAMGDYRVARQDEAQIVADVARLTANSTKISGAQVPLTELERDLLALQASYDRFARVKDNVSQQEADSPPARVIATARPPVSPSAPKPALVILLSGGTGLFVGLAAALLGRRPAPRLLARPIEEPSPRDTSRGRQAPARPEQPEPEQPALQPRYRRPYWDDTRDTRA